MSTSGLVPFPHRLQDAEHYRYLATNTYTSGVPIPYWKDQRRPAEPLPTNCKNCGAPLRSVECDYCNTKYHQ